MAEVCEMSAWGHHITLQAIADMLSVKINVLSSNHPMFSVTPGVCSAECDVFVGLILQYHYVGLDKLPVCGQNVQSSSSTADVHSNPSVNTVSTANAHSNPSVNTVSTADVHSNPSAVQQMYTVTLVLMQLIQKKKP